MWIALLLLGLALSQSDAHVFSSVEDWGASSFIFPNQQTQDNSFAQGQFSQGIEAQGQFPQGMAAQSGGQSRAQLSSIDNWGAIDFAFPNQQLRDNAIQQGQFVQRMAVPIDIDVHYGKCEDFQRTFNMNFK